ncbi:Gfo/Idh/MocA family oxidoreductase [Mucilaginibacter mali]|uniref:Gfo/Idh/MocA family oxidoreductase n=1 Tax=Mucilaginibacter mali TaxID=2740462 RepID=A0A7D4UCJ3_9SPHI|nr:Gfo/Idh/MocA family oxidoreductase [Mucilaginibacter mali]QKJ29399.1 Gfo/Idh/MocA family oxidoreductase [Mucilaginibacter mali]
MEGHILIIGLGSMGKRRIRNLSAIGLKNIIGFDKREDRCAEASDKYKIPTATDFDSIIHEYEIKAFVISVPPDVHHIYMNKALQLNIPAFIEASVVDTGMEEIIKEADKKNICLAPSCTLYFHPAIQKIKSIIEKGELGTISNFLYHSGQYLPDWHTYENVSDYYVSNKATGGGREIVPFELTWITMILGLPKKVVAFYKKAINIQGAEEIDDTYNLLLDYNTMIFNLTVDVVSRHATRRLVINGDKKQLSWDWDDNAIKIFEPESNQWDEITYEITSAQAGYNKNITEQIYIDEMDAFLKAVAGEGFFPNTLSKDHKVLQLLYAAERSCDEDIIVKFI